MGVLEIIEFFDESGEIMISRVPPEGSGETRLGSQLIVQESQVAVFYRDGQALDVFKPGRHTLTTANLPLLQKIIGLPFGGKSPFRAYVYFVALKTFANLGWGTPTPVVFRDADLRMVTLRAHGVYSMRIRDPRVFLNTLVGTRGLETTFHIEDFFRSIIVSRLNAAISGTMKSILDLPAQYDHVALTVKQTVKDDFEQYGIELIDLIVEAITVPQSVQEMINRATGIAAQEVDKYKEIAIADAMRDAAQNPGGPGTGIGAGLGLGVGFGMAKELAGQFGGAKKQEAPEKPPPPAGADGSRDGGGQAASGPRDDIRDRGGTPPPTGTKPTLTEIKAKLASLKELRDEGLISEADFEARKERLLDQL